MILETGVVDAIYCHCDVVTSVDLVCEYLARIEDRIVGVARVMAPEQEPVAQGIVSILVRLNVKYSGFVVGMDRLWTRGVKRVSRHR